MAAALLHIPPLGEVGRAHKTAPSLPSYEIIGRSSMSIDRYPFKTESHSDSRLGCRTTYHADISNVTAGVGDGTSYSIFCSHATI